MLGCQFQTLEGQQMNVTWKTRATKSSSVSQGEKSNSWILLSSSHSPIGNISSKCVQWSNEQLRVILGSDM